MVLGFYQVASGLEAMHDKGIICQDIKADNILCNETDTVWKVADLGNSARNRVNGEGNKIAAKDCG